MTFFPLDWHTPTHLFGSFFLTHLVFWWRGLRVRKLYIEKLGRQHLLKARIPLKRVRWQGAALVWCLGALWEVFDQLLAGWLIFDPRGGDFADIIADTIGILLRIAL